MTIEQPNFGKLLRLISTQADEEQLRLIADAINRRFKLDRQMRDNETRAQIQIGSRVQYFNCSPQYLIGCTGRVVEFKNSRILVQLDRGPVGKFRTGRVLSHAANLKVLPDALEVPAQRTVDQLMAEIFPNGFDIKVQDFTGEDD